MVVLGALKLVELVSRKIWVAVKFLDLCNFEHSNSFSKIIFKICTDFEKYPFFGEFDIFNFAIIDTLTFLCNPTEKYFFYFWTMKFDCNNILVTMNFGHPNSTQPKIQFLLTTEI